MKGAGRWTCACGRSNFSPVHPCIECNKPAPGLQAAQPEALEATEGLEAGRGFAPGLDHGPGLEAGTGAEAGWPYQSVETAAPVAPVSADTVSAEQAPAVQPGGPEAHPLLPPLPPPPGAWGTPVGALGTTTAGPPSAAATPPVEPPVEAGLEAAPPSPAVPDAAPTPPAIDPAPPVQAAVPDPLPAAAVPPFVPPPLTPQPASPSSVAPAWRPSARLLIGAGAGAAILVVTIALIALSSGGSPARKPVSASVAAQQVAAALLTRAPAGYQAAVAASGANGPINAAAAAKVETNPNAAVLALQQTGFEGGYARTWIRATVPGAIVDVGYQFSSVAGAKRYYDLYVKAQQNKPGTTEFAAPGFGTADGFTDATDQALTLQTLVFQSGNRVFVVGIGDPAGKATPDDARKLAVQQSRQAELTTTPAK